MLQKELLNLRGDSCKNITVEKLNIAYRMVKRICKHFPGFPDTDLIIALSGHEYEGKSCYSNMLFLSHFYSNHPIKYVFEYSEPISFQSNNLRFIRKLLESVNEEHCLVMKEIKQNSEDLYEYQAVGVIKMDIAKRLLAPCVTFLGRLKWKLSIKEQGIYQYENGSYHTIDENRFDEEEFKDLLANTFGCQISEESINIFGIIADIITNLGHGTSIVIFKSQETYSNEMDRLTQHNSGHGIKLKNEIRFHEKTKEEINAILKEITQIDGGLIFDINGNCGAISCVFDGKVPEKYDKGSNSRGSRYNSMVLYIESLNAKSALGIVVSDDKSIDYICKER